jgi:hypothetical protein
MRRADGHQDQTFSQGPAPSRPWHCGWEEDSSKQACRSEALKERGDTQRSELRGECP